MTQRQLEKKINKIYAVAAVGIGAKWYKYFDEGEKKFANKEAQINEAKRNGDIEAADELEGELKQEKQDYTVRNKEYAAVLSVVVLLLTKTNQEALTEVNESLPVFYRKSYNSELYDEMKQIGIKYNLIDSPAVRLRIKEGDIRLPYKRILPDKDKRWNTKQINAQIIQGIQKGESMDKIAKRLEPIMDNNKAAAIRNARTLVNGAENAGRLDRYFELEKMGVILKKVWLATGDSRTRDWHLVMDGQAVDLRSNFIDGNGNRLYYPGDARAPAETVYNCRCGMESKLVGFKKADGTIMEFDNYDEATRHSEEIQKEIERREEKRRGG